MKEIIFRAAKRLGIPVILVANRPLHPPAGNSMVTAVRVGGGADVADAHIVAEAIAGDLVITQDIPLAALLVPNDVVVLDPRGDEHTAETIGERLSIRDFMEQARSAGMVTGGPPPTWRFPSQAGIRRRARPYPHTPAPGAVASPKMRRCIAPDRLSREGRCTPSRITPILNVSNIRQSFAWFVKLGWTKGWDWGNPPTFGGVCSGECEIFLCEGAQGGRGRSDLAVTAGIEGAEEADKGVWMLGLG